MRQGRNLGDAIMSSLPEADDLQEAQLLLVPAFAHAHSGSRGSSFQGEPGQAPAGKGGRQAAPSENPGPKLSKEKGKERAALATDKAELGSVTQKFANAQEEIANLKKRGRNYSEAPQGPWARQGPRQGQRQRWQREKRRI